MDDDADITSVTCTCLFCFEISSSPEAVFKHCSLKHEIDIVKMIKEYGTVFFVRDTKLTNACAIDA